MKNWGYFILLILALVVQMMVVMPSGSYYCSNNLCGIFFWGAHEHDGVWHLALINSAFSVWPARFPTFSGEILSGYNAMLDLGLYIVKSLTGISSSFLYFKLVPALWFGTMVIVWRKFATVFSKHKSYGFWLFFFIFFGNSLSYLLKLFNEGTIWGASGILSMQSPQMLNNIQYALTLPFVGMLLLIFMRTEIRGRDFASIVIINFLIMGLKFYGGVIALLMSGVYSLLLMYQRKLKESFMAGLSAILGFTTATWFFYNPLANLGGSPILSWRPMATIHPIIEDASLLYLPSIANLRNNLYMSEGGIRLWLIELTTLAIFILFNYGTRLVGLIRIKSKPINWIIVSGIIGGLLLNILFVQRGEWWNTVQFLYYSLFLASIFAAQTLSDWIEGGTGKRVIASIIVVLTLPNALDTVRIFASFPPQSYVSQQEIEALEVLGKLPEGSVLALPLEARSRVGADYPRPLYSRYDTAYVAAFSGKQTYLNDLVQLRLTDIEYNERLDLVTQAECAVLEEIKYIYSAGDNPEIAIYQQCPAYEIKEIYLNEEAAIFAVSPR